MTCEAEWLRKNVCEVLVFRNVGDVNGLLDDKVAYVMSENVDVFGFREVDRVLCHLKSSLVIGGNTKGVL